jgi:hypothetical protein
MDSHKKQTLDGSNDNLKKVASDVSSKNIYVGNPKTLNVSLEHAAQFA